MEININHEVEDTFYRYKMPKLSAKVEGKGNGIKTVIVNVTDIAKALYRKPIYVTKFFGCELGAQIYVDEKNDRYIVNGSHEPAKLQELLHSFIKKFVLCQNCGNPETTLNVKKKAAIVATACKACGNRGQLDTRHRLTQFIIKNPPVDEVINIEVTRGKKSKRVKNATEQNSDDDRSGTEQKNGQVHDSDTDDDDWGDDITDEAQQQRLNELSCMAKSLALCADVEKTETERVNIFFKHVTQIKKENLLLKNSRNIKLEADRLNLGGRAVLVVAEVLLNNVNTIVSDIERFQPVFILFTRTGEQQQKVQAYVLGAIAILIDKNINVLLNKSCHILKKLYDCDIVEEEVILSWFAKNGAIRYVSKETAALIANICSPMLNWLAEADEESEEDDVDEEEEKYSNDSQTETNANKSPKHSSANSIDDSDEEVDIDAI